MNELQLKLSELVKSFGKTGRKDKWFIDGSCPYTDYCREIVKPGVNDTFPDGAVGLRVDGDFWAVAAIPYEYVELSCKEIVDVLFPFAEDPTYLADSGSVEQLKESLASSERNLEECKKIYPDDPKQCRHFKESVDYYKNKVENFSEDGK